MTKVSKKPGLPNFVVPAVVVGLGFGWSGMLRLRIVPPLIA